MTRLSQVEVVVADHDVDAMFIERDGRTPVLVLREHQSFESAVAAVQKIAPKAPRSAVRGLVAKHLPEAADLRDMLSIETAIPAALDFQWAGMLKVPLVVGVLAMTTLLAGFYFLHADAYAATRAPAAVAAAAGDAVEDLGDAAAAPARAAQTTSDTAPQPGVHGRKGAPIAGTPSSQAPVPPWLRRKHLLVVPPGYWRAHGSSAGAPQPLPLPLDAPSCDRDVFVTLAEAYFKEGPTSSTSTSNTVLFSPSRVSYDLALRLPCTMTRIPRCSDSAAFSAACRHTLHARKSASPSTHSLRLLSKRRGVDATVKLATAAPDGVKRSSGSAVKLPTTVIGVSPDTEPSPSLVKQATHLLLGD